MPDLIVIAGCNGAGKSTFASSFLPEGLNSFDYDRLYLENYNSLPDSELRDVIAGNLTSETFTTTIEKTLAAKLDFCYETNFDQLPIHWPEIFKKNGYCLNLIFFCLDNQEIAKHRVLVRTEFKGHYVDENTIDIKWKAGYKNVNIHFSFFDNVLFVDNSTSNEVYTNIFQIKNKQITLMTDQIPKYFEHRLPKIYKLLQEM